MSRRFFPSLLIVLLAIGTSCAAASPPAAENSAEAGELRYRRVYFPEGMKEWPTGAVKYLPMDANEFERLIGAVQRTAPAAPGQASVGIVEAKYAARLKGPALLQGSATLDVSQSIASAMLMTLDPCNLAISRAQWVTSDGAPAVLGLTGDGKLQVLAERSGQMKFDWSLAGQRDLAGGVSFTVALPPSPVNRLLIELPAELAPAVDHGIVTDEGPTDPGFRRWRLELGGRPGCRLRLAKPGEEAQPQTVLASQSGTYDFSLRGVDIKVTLKIEGHREPLPKVVLGLDPSVELVEVSTGNEELAWIVVAGRGDKARQATISLPPSLQAGPATLRLRAIAPLARAGSWKLPRIEFRGAVYRSNTIRLLVPLPLSIARLETHECRQTGTAVMQTPPGEQFDFEGFGGDAGVEVSLVQRPTEIEAVSATATLLGQGKMSSRVATDFRTSDGSVFALEAEVLPNWTIDSVESQPTDGLDDWTLGNRGGTRRLSIRLARSLSATRPLRLIVSARRLYAFPGRNLGIDDLVPLRFVGLSESTRWVDLHASGSNELHFTSADNLHRADVKELTAAELDLFAELPGDLLFRDDLRAAGVRLSLENRRPTYSAAIRLEAIAGDALLAENYSLVCTPSRAAPIDRVVVHFAGHREGPISWSVTGMDESRFSARRWTAQQEASAGLTADEENWDVTFRSPRSVPLEIHASRKVKLSGPTPVCLVSLPDAARQEATLIVRSLGPQIVVIKTHRLKPLPTEAAPPGQMQTVRATYQYDPRTDTMPQSEPAIVLTPAESESAAAWVWDCDVRSQFAANGTADHVVTYRIQNAGSRQIRLALPAGLVRSDVHEIWLNDKPAAALSAADSAAADLDVDLPANLKFVTLVLQITTHGEPLGTFCRLQPPLPAIGLPIFVRHWRLELPPGYATCSYGQDSQSAATSFSVRRCLLGCLRRSQDQSIFNPFRRDDWQALLPWRKTEDRPPDPAADADVSGWTRYPIDVADGASTVLVIRRATIDAAGWTLFVAVVAVGAWGLSRRRLALLLLVVILGLPALLLPAALSVFFSDGLLGVMFCLLLGLVPRRPSVAGTTPSEQPKEMASTLTNIVPFGAPLLAAAMLCGWDSAAAGETAKAAPVTHSVFIPMNEKQQPTKGKYFLPESFYAELYRRAALQAEKPQGWMIASAVYRAALTDDAAQARHVVERLTAEFDIHVFNAASRVRIPLRREEVSLEPGQAKLDDRSVQPDWEPDGSALLLEKEIAEPGDYRLELTLRPTLRPGNRSAGFDLAIPRVPTSHFEMTVPAGGPQVEFPSALGEVQWEEAQSRWTAELGPSGRLAAVWQDDAPAGATAAVDCEQLLWLKFEPGCVLFDVRIKAKAASGQFQRLLVRADSALEWLPSANPAAPAVQARGGGDASQTYDIQWPQPVDSATFDLHFLCGGTSSLGTFHVPQIEVVDARPVRRLLAVSINPGLEYQMPGARLQETGAVPEFISNWGTIDSPPELAFRLNGNAAEWNLTTSPRRAETSGDQNAAWSFNAQTAELEFDAQLTASAGSLFQYRLEAPPTLHVVSMAVLAEGVKHPVRWSQDKDGSITVFPASPVSGRHELHVHGQMPLPKSHKFALPQVRLEELHIQNSTISLYRRPDVLVEVSGVAGLADVKTPADADGLLELGRPVRSFYIDSAATSAPLLSIRANLARVRAEQTTQIACEENQCQATCEFSLQVSDGLLDSIELDVPASWKESVKTSPGMTSTFAASSDEHTTLVLSPSAAISGTYNFTLTGPPAAAAGFAVPNVSLKHVKGVKKYVILPSSAARPSIAWDLKNLRPRKAQADAKQDAVDLGSDETVTYEVVGEPWQAVLRLRPKTAAASRVVQADIRYAWQADGRCLGAALFDVETAGAIEYPLTMPAGFQLLQLSVDGLPVDAAASATGSWIVPLASLGSVSHVELLFFADSAIPSSPTALTRQCSFHAPKLGDLPFERIAWTIASPRALQPAIAQRGLNSPLPASSANPASGDIPARWQRFVEEGHAVSYTTSGTQDTITLDYRPIAAQSWLARLAGIAGFLVAVGLAALFIRRGLLGNWFARWPYLFGVGCGLAWWLWLSPSAVGLLIVLAVLWRQLLSWRRRLRIASI